MKTVQLNSIDLSQLAKTEQRFQHITTPAAKVVDLINNALWAGTWQFMSQKFTWIDVPIMTKVTGACENVDTLYEVDHFGKKSFLAQTGQLYLEAKIPLHKEVWTIMTSSRAEHSVDGRHLNQFPLIEMEHQGDLQTVLKNIEACVKAMITMALQKTSEELELLGRTEELQKWVKEPFNKITYTEVIDMLEGTSLSLAWGEDLKAEHEAAVVQLLGNKPTFITHFPKAIKFFNMRQNDDNPDVVNSSDLIMPYAGEATGAAERENRYDLLVQRLVESPMFKTLQKRGVQLAEFEDYLQLIKQHPVLHSGCGIGFSRISQAVLGVDDIRITTPFPIQRGTLY